MSTSNAHPAQTGRNTAVLLVTLRRLVSRELGIALDLGDDNALRELHQQALRCKSEAVGELLKQLEAHLPKLPAAPEPSTARASGRSIAATRCRHSQIPRKASPTPPRAVAATTSLTVASVTGARTSRRAD